MATAPSSAPTIRAPRGSERSCKSWQAEAALRMLMNNLDPEVAEIPEQLVVYGGSGRAARSWEDFERICASLKSLEPDETLLVQSGRAVGIIRTHVDAPRVLISNSMLVPKWATWDEFRRLEAAGLTMYGQMTAGSWIYIGTQGILQGTYETFGACARQHFGGTLAGKLVVTGGLGGMGGAQPLAATMNGATCLSADVEQSRIDKRITDRYNDRCVSDLDAAIDAARAARDAQEAVSIAWCGNIVDLLKRMVERDITPDILTDQTSAHDALNGYVPDGMDLAAAFALRESDPKRYVAEATRTMADHIRAMLELQSRGAITFDYGNNLRGQAEIGGVTNAFDIPGFVPEYIRPLFCEGSGPFRWAALSGDPADIARTDRAVLETFPNNDHLARWIKLASERVAFQGLPARICWLSYGERAKMGQVFNELVASGEVSAPLAIGRDHLDCGSVASPNRETEAMLDGSDAIGDWPILNALANTACGASWVSVHHGGGVGMGFSLHAGQVVVADGTPEAAQRLQRVLTADPGLGVMRHVDAGYDRAVEIARERDVQIPKLK